MKAQSFKSSDFKYIGIEHNEMLDNLYLKLKKRSQKKNTEKNIKDLIVVVYTEYTTKTNKCSKKSINIGIELIKNLNISRYLNKKLYDDKIESKITEKTAFYLNKLGDIINTKGVDSKSLKNKITRLENSIDDEKLSNKELVILYSATNMAKYSFEYWEKNFKEWVTLNENINYNKMAGPGPGSIIVGADVSGAVGAAVYAAVMNAVPGGGQVAYGATILATGLGASATAAVGVIWNWLFD